MLMTIKINFHSPHTMPSHVINIHMCVIIIVVIVVIIMKLKEKKITFMLGKIEWAWDYYHYDCS